MSLASARAALFAASLASACNTQHEHTCQSQMETYKGIKETAERCNKNNHTVEFT